MAITRNRSTNGEGDAAAASGSAGIRGQGRASTMLCAVFFLSGAAALIFETLWFRLAGLTFGNSVWASALVLSAFMGGLALGNGLAAWYGHRVARPVTVYAAVEIIVGASGVFLVLIFPFLTVWLAPLFSRFLDTAWALNPLRLTLAFLLMIIPATAMGTTLPLLVRALHRHSPHFGRVLGRLYGWNTLGAVCGALITEVGLVELLGIRGSGILAGLLNGASAAGALWVARVRPWVGEASGAEALPSSGRSAALVDVRTWLFAAFLCGGILLALEVVWFRFLILFMDALSLAFAVMLAVVLAGIALGGMAGSVLLRWWPRAYTGIAWIAFLSGAMTVASYGVFGHVVAAAPSAAALWPRMAFLAIPLMFPVSFLSGTLFTLIGEALNERVRGEYDSTGLLTMVNTTGAMLGSALAGFVLLPVAGMEKSFFLLALLYGVVALSIMRARTEALVPGRNAVVAGFAAIFGISLVFFPFGSMERHILSVGRAHYANRPEWQPVAIREGITETSQYWQRKEGGKPLYTRLFTNSHPMSSTTIQAQRYMNFFVYWPVAVHPDLQRALLICYGVGCTAKALTDTPTIRTIDVVDISPDILAGSEIVFPDSKQNPLHDPRVRIHVEDGRFFLLTTQDRFDLITGEPPPPLSAGIVNLYTQEYFQLMYDRLREGGMVTYWLPVTQLTWSALKSVLKAFSNVFDDCSLWTGSGFEWVMVGAKRPKSLATELQFRRQWTDPVVGRQMARCGFERPEQIGATFLLDAAHIREWTQASLPLVDNHPKRIFGKRSDYSEYTLIDLEGLMNTRRAGAAFSESPTIEELWPETLRKQTLPYFAGQDLINRVLIPMWQDEPFKKIELLFEVLSGSTLKFPVYWIMWGPEFPNDPAEAHSSQPVSDRGRRGFSYDRAVRALADRDFVGAAQFFSEEERGESDPALSGYRVFALCMAGRLEEARELVASRRKLFASTDGTRFLEWLNQQFPAVLTKAEKN